MMHCSILEIYYFLAQSTCNYMYMHVYNRTVIGVLSKLSNIFQVPHLSIHMYCTYTCVSVVTIDIRCNICWQDYT